MRTGICGGTFDPLHLGHAALVNAALASGLVERILVIPSGTPPHKRQALVSPAAYRFEMACRAFAEDERVDVSDLEILREGPSYTLDTARMLQEANPQDTFFLIYGSDILRDIERWHQPAALLARWPLLLADRGGITDEESRRLAEQLRRQLGARICFFPAPAIDLSATQIRRLAAEGQAVDHYVLPGVARFIQRHGLYRWHSELAGTSPQLWEELNRLEQQLWPLLTRKRLLHSLNVLMYALHLAIRHHEDLRLVAIAAILHDCAKCLSREKQMDFARRTGDQALLDDKMIHGPAGASLAAERFAISDPVILRAIHCHTTGCAGMNPVDQIIFIADKVEPARTYANLEMIRQLAETDLDRATRLCLQEINAFLIRASMAVHPYAAQAMADMEQRIATREYSGSDGKSE